MKYLMARNNVDGVKLEDILNDICADIREKNSFLENAASEDVRTAQYIRINNNTIIELLKAAYTLQVDSMNYLEEQKGPNKGPKEPRL